MEHGTGHYLTQVEATAEGVRDALRDRILRMVADGTGSLSILGLRCSLLYADAVRCVAASCARSLSADMDKSICVLASGSIAAQTATPSSDVDLVILAPIEDPSPATVFRDLLVPRLDECGFPNTDCAIVGVGATRCSPPTDLIDRQIAEGAHYLMGNPLLYRYYLRHAPCISQTTTELLLRHSINRRADLQWRPSSSSQWKHASGGRRDLMRIEHFAGRLASLYETGEEARAILHQACCHHSTFDNWEAYHAWTAILPSFLPIEPLPSADQLDVTANHVAQLYVQAERLLVSSLPHPCRSLYMHLDERGHSDNPITLEDVKAVMTKVLSMDLTPYALFMLKTVNEEALSLASRCGWLGFLALATNPNTPGDILHCIATIPGYEWRNIRDQVPKHPNVQRATLTILAQSDLRFTRVRAREVLACRDANN